MTATRTHTAKRSLQLCIDPSPYGDSESRICVSPSDTTTTSSSSFSGRGTSTSTAYTSPSSAGTEYSVLCIYDFESDDPDHLPFRKNEILEVVKQEDTGWCAAIRANGSQVGWIPRAFVEPLTEEMTERLWHIREELRVFEFDAERLYTSAPVSSSHHYDLLPSPSPSPSHQWVPVVEGAKVRSTMSPAMS
jgi:son of sevenless-like protein